MNIALVGNPNCGKTTLFNRLTGSRQKVGNWPGVTVEKKVGVLLLDGKQTEQLTDLPGVYNLEQIEPGQDEKVATNFLIKGEADLIINVVDATNLNRNLVLTSQLLELNTPLILAVNMVDVAQQKGLEIDLALLAERLKVPVLPVIGSTGKGFGRLVEEISKQVEAVKQTQQTQAEAVANCGFGDEKDQLLGRRSLRDRSVERFKLVKALTEGVVCIVPGKRDTTDNIDQWVLNRWLGVPIFLLMMYLMFTIAINFGSVFIDFFDILFKAVLVDGMTHILSLMSAPEWLKVIVADGIGGGVQLVATFIPVIGFLYLCLSILEDSGYLSRAAFVVDRLMAGIGLPGNAFVPLIVGFGCNVPAVMAARTMHRESDRLLTIVMAPFMSCGARLTVYALFAAAFFPTNGQNVVFLLYLLGIVVAVFSGWIFRRQVFAAKAAPSFIEMPAYHLPVWRNIFTTTWHRLRGFMTRAGKTIVLVVTLLSFLNSIGTDGSFGNENSDKSILSKIGQIVTPIFTPIGIEEHNWPATVGIFTGMFAKEAIVGTLDALYVGEQTNNQEPDLWRSVGEAFGSILTNAEGLADTFTDPLGLASVSDHTTLQESQGIHQQTLTQMAAAFHGQMGAFAYLVLILLYTPCVAVLGAIKREAGSMWMWVVILWTSYLAYGLSSCIYQLSQIMTNPVFALSWIAGAILLWVGFVAWLKQLGNQIRNREIFAVNVD